MDSQVSNPTVAGSKPARCVAPSTTETQEKQGGNAPVPADSASPAKSANVGQTAEHPANESCSPVVAPKTGYGPAYVHFASDYGVCWRWLRTKDQDGYGYFRAGGKHIKAHQHYWRERFGEIPAGMELDHKCRNRWCVNPDHLEPVPHIENCRRGGLVKTGMTIEKAREVRALAAAGVKQKDIAERFGIGKSLVAQIVTNRCWREAALAPADRRAGQQHDAAFSAWRFMHTTPRRQP